MNDTSTKEEKFKAELDALYSSCMATARICRLDTTPQREETLYNIIKEILVRYDGMPACPHCKYWDALNTTNPPIQRIVPDYHNLVAQAWMYKEEHLLFIGHCSKCKRKVTYFTNGAMEVDYSYSETESYDSVGKLITTKVISP